MLSNREPLAGEGWGEGVYKIKCEGPLARETEYVTKRCVFTHKGLPLQTLTAVADEFLSPNSLTNARKYNRSTHPLL